MHTIAKSVARSPTNRELVYSDSQHSMCGAYTRSRHAGRTVPTRDEVVLHLALSRLSRVTELAGCICRKDVQAAQKRTEPRMHWTFRRSRKPVSE